MKLISFMFSGEKEVGLVHSSKLYRLKVLEDSIPMDMTSILEGGVRLMDKLKEIDLLLQRSADLKDGVESLSRAQVDWEKVELLAPVPKPGSCRDAYAFRQHVETSRTNRGLDMIPEFDAFPVFYFTNHRAINGPGDIYCMPEHFDRLDFELEVAVVLQRAGRNIAASEADSYIGGYMIMNDWSARGLQMAEMKLNLGPAKGKDFSTSFGPWLVTPDELSLYQVPTAPGHTGAVYDLTMSCRVNGVEVSKGSLADMHWTFAEIIERASYGVDLYPGDVIGSGTVGTGCFFELNGTGLRRDPKNFTEQWLEPGDRIELEVTGLGILENRVLSEAERH